LKNPSYSIHENYEKPVELRKTNENNKQELYRKYVKKKEKYNKTIYPARHDSDIK
jgi:hypothetical protein